MWIIIVLQGFNLNAQSQIQTIQTIVDQLNSIKFEKVLYSTVTVMQE